MKNLLFALLITIGFSAQAQVYNNEWIDYTKTYYKFKVGRTGLYRIPQSTLANAGLGSAPAEQFKLWRNGVEVPIYTSKAIGAFGVSDYIEFWGQMNDGTPDTELYRLADYHLNRKWSLETDTAAYFLTVHAGTNKRLNITPNNVAGNSLPAEPYFMFTAGNYFRHRIHSGYAVNVGEYLYSSSYDKAEGWSSNDIGTNGTQTTSLSNLFVYTGAGAPTAYFNLAVSGNAIHPRTYKASINGDSIVGSNVDYFNYKRDTSTVNLNTISSGSATVQITNQCLNANDRMVVHYYELSYPRQFNFGGAASFEFELPASAQGNYLQITGFNYGSTPPVLYDATNGQRYAGDISNSSYVQFVLQPSSVKRKLVLVNEEAGNITNITSLQTRNFIDYRTTANQADYMIITHPLLFNGANGINPVEQYRDYRSSVTGGSYNAKIYLEDEINDQYGFGIKKNPAALRNFIRYARINYTVKPKHIFIIGKGVHYVHHRGSESNPDMAKLNLVTTYGWPGSDVLLTAEPGSSIPEVPIGRLSAINAAEVALYLKKVQEFETAQATMSPLVQDRGWMKNVVHINGSGDPQLAGILGQYLDIYRRIISDTLFGGHVTTFAKTSSSSVQQLTNTQMQNLFAEGISLMTYFGHSSSSTLEFNLDNPENYYNPGKYPMFMALGCNAGNFFNFNPLRFQTKETLSEKYVLAPDRGTIGFVASTHFGIVHYLDIWNSRAYRRISNTSYGKTFGEIMKETVVDVFNFTSQEDFYARANSEQTELHGDPALRINPHPKPDYVIEEPMVRATPNFISVADSTFRLDAKVMNIGRAPGRNIVVEIKRQYPNGTTQVVQRDTIPGIRYIDSVTAMLRIDPIRDKGLNKITVTVEADNVVDEIYETNNSITKDIFIYEDEARPVYPYNLAIINKQNIKLTASTANPFNPSRQYRMELDTTELFNSSAKVSRTITSPGGVIEFDPAITFSDSTVYYWRVAPVPSSGNNYTWNTSSFVYLSNYEVGFNQSHLHQQFKSSGVKISLDSASRQWKFGTKMNNLFIRQGTWVSSGAVQQAALSVAINGATAIRGTCYFQSLVFNVFDPVTFRPWQNIVVIPENSPGYPLGLGLHGSHANKCRSDEERYYHFEYRYTDSATRRQAMNFMQNVVPDGAYVVVRNFTLDPNTFPGFPHAFINDWMQDAAVYGAGQTLYHYLKNAGLSSMDSFYRARPFALVYKKNDPTFTPRWLMGDGIYDNPTLSVDAPTPDTLGFITSPVFGPAKAWKELHWKGRSIDATAGDNPTVSLIGITPNGLRDTLIQNIDVTQSVVDVSSVNAQQYPYAQLMMTNQDPVHLTPYQLNYWRLTYVPAPEGAVAPNVFFQMKDTFEVGEPIDFKMAFKNVAGYNFDSLKVKMVVTDRNNVTHVLPVQKHRSLTNNPDTLHIRYNIDTRQLTGANALYVEVNPDNDQPEQYHFNNFIYRNFYVKGDTLNPLLDVTFDNVHILNNDIVSSKPDIMIKLKDEARWFLLDTNSVVDVKVRFPDQTIRSYNYNSDTLKFLPAQQAPNSDNTATVNFKPYFPEDGAYELIVTGKDMSGNKAGTMEYRVGFQVINTPMISNMLNYPNPFTTSTAFVFTITGSEVPQNIRIQILTVTGKIVREITKDELGPLHIGRNITEFKWDGTDMYGQKLANGVYLYRVVTNLNGKSLDKYKAEDDNTDKYFNKGYGKMYLMR
jgi:hypothetical protein